MLRISVNQSCYQLIISWTGRRPSLQVDADNIVFELEGRAPPRPEDENQSSTG